MDEKEQNQTPILPETPKKRNLFWSFLTGASISATVDLAIEGIFAKLYAKRGRAFTPSSTQNMLGWAVGTGAVWALIDAYRNKSDAKGSALNQPLALPPTPPTLPAEPRFPALATVPQILDLLVADGALKPEQKAQVLDQIKQGRTGFAGEIAVADGFVTKAQVDEALADQAMAKVLKAQCDLENIVQFGTIPAPVWLKANWGNNGVNPSAPAPTKIDGICAAANIAQNLVMLANANPDLGRNQVIEDGIRAASRLATGINMGDSKIAPLAKMHDAWRATMNLALEHAAAYTKPELMTDNNGKLIDIHAYIAARDAEIDAAIAQTLQQPPREAGLTR